MVHISLSKIVFDPGMVECRWGGEFVAIGMNCRRVDIERVSKGTERNEGR
jgi:hypothetical protein